MKHETYPCITLTTAIAIPFCPFASRCQAQVHFRNYSPGRYYDRNGVKHTGFIDFGNNFWGTVKINFREGVDTAANQKISISDMTALVVMHQPDTAYAPGTLNLAKQMVADSFVVIQEEC